MVFMELKSEKGLSRKELEALSTEALHQIDDKKYDRELLDAGFNKILKLGIAFSGKLVKIKTN